MNKTVLVLPVCAAFGLLGLGLVTFAEGEMLSILRMAAFASVFAALFLLLFGLYKVRRGDGGGAGG